MFRIIFYDCCVHFINCASNALHLQYFRFNLPNDGELSPLRVVQVLYSQCTFIGHYHQKAINWFSCWSMNEKKSPWITPTQQTIYSNFSLETRNIFSPVETQLRSIKMELILGQDLNLQSTKWKNKSYISVDWHENSSTTGPHDLFVGLTIRIVLHNKKWKVFHNAAFISMRFRLNSIGRVVSMVEHKRQIFICILNRISMDISYWVLDFQLWLYSIKHFIQLYLFGKNFSFLSLTE